ncbi:MAG: HNH endonuclease [Clostridia bacterium]|nr:HNH endonuclease [Clostridia bacterium]
MNDPISVASLYFFLKNKDEYAVARKQGTGEKLNKLGHHAACVQKCTWAGYQEYLNIVKEIKDLLPSELNATLLDAQSFLWMLWMVKEDTPEYVVEEPEFHDYSYGLVNIQKNQWLDLIRRGTITEKDIEYLAKFYASPNHASNLKRLAELEGKHPSSFITSCTSLGRKVSEIFSIPSIPREGKPDSEKLYPIVFLGRSLSNGLFEWKLRPELTAALEETYPQILAAETVKMEEIEEQEAAKLSVEELLIRARNSRSGPADTYTSTSQQRRRNPLLQLAAKARANGVCQLCGATLGFKDKQGRPYLEAHHIVPLAEDGPDELSNMVALCPNCHRKMHVVRDQDDIAKLIALAEL